MSDEQQPQPRATLADGEPPKLPAPPAAVSTPATPSRTYLVDGRRLPPHPAAELLPLLDEAELEELKIDILTHSQREDVLLDVAGIQVVDGRNRCIACERARIPVAFRRLPADEDLTAVIVSANIHRRHLTTGQRAMVAVALANLQRGGDAGRPKAAPNELNAPPLPVDSGKGNSGETAAPKSGGEPEIIVRGQGRPAGGVDTVGKGRAPRGTSRKSSIPEGTNRQDERLVSQSQAAKMTRVAVSTIRKAKAVANDPILAPALRAGQISVDAAYTARHADENTKRRLVAGDRGAARTMPDLGGDLITPDRILTIALRVLDQSIDLDPASSTEAQKAVNAKRFLTPEEDALKPDTSWGEANDSLDVWLHPPGDAASLFAERLLTELENRTVGRACWFGAAAFEAPWYRRLLRKSSAFATFDEPVRKGASQSYVFICFRIRPKDLHDAVGDRGLVSTVFRPARSA